MIGQFSMHCTFAYHCLTFPGGNAVATFSTVVEAFDFLLEPDLSSKEPLSLNFYNHFLQSLGRHQTTDAFFKRSKHRNFSTAAST